MSSFFRPFTSHAPIANLTRRVELQKLAYEQALRDLNEAREARGLFPLEGMTEGGIPVEARRLPTAVVDTADLAAKIIAADRKARALEPVEKPAEGSLAAKIIAAAAKARGEK